MIRILENWKRKQGEDKPVMIFINVSGGGLQRHFVMNSLQHLDSMTGGKPRKHTMLISGPAAALAQPITANCTAGNCRIVRLTGMIPGTPTISPTTCWNPLFSSMVAGDIFAGRRNSQVGEYGYVERPGIRVRQKLDRNAGHLLGGQLKKLAHQR